MILSTLALLCCSALSRTTPPLDAAPAAERQTRWFGESSEPVAGASASLTKPDAPTPKFSLPSNFDAESNAEPLASATPEPLKTPIKPATPESYETSRQRKIWYGLMAVNHGAAAFDAWTTRRAIGGGYGTEGDPLQRPFANSNAIYATTQVVPVLMDYMGHRMMRSGHPTIRKFWWIPQAASAGVSMAAGVHNYRLVH